MFRATIAIAAACLVLQTIECHGQTSRFQRLQPRPSTGTSRKQGTVTTTVSVELIQVKPGPNPLGLKWQHVFAKQNMSLRIRSGRPGDKPSISETKLGAIRLIKAIGIIDTTGRILFPKNKVFTLADSAELGKWLEDLKTFGEQGSPDGKPLWGLSESQFSEFYSSLSAPVLEEVAGLRLDNALEKMALPKQYSASMSGKAVEWLKTEYPDAPKVRSKLQGFSKGTALAILLNEYGLGFHPLRKPDGKLDLIVEPLKVTRAVWPVGWDLKESRVKTARKLFMEFVPIDLENVLFVDVINAVSVKAEIPIFIDRYRIEGFGVDVDKLRVSFQSNRTSWFRLLGAITTPNHLTRRDQIDEAGKPFIWVTYLQPKSVTN